MPCIVGVGNSQYWQDDDGTLWSMDRKTQIDPETYEPLGKKCGPSTKPVMKKINKLKWIRCEQCSFKTRHKAALDIHMRSH